MWPGASRSLLSRMVAEKKVSVVLGGGGAKGFVHLGVLQAIVDGGYDVVALYGTSIGSIVASLFAYQFVFDHLEKGKPRAEAQKAAISGVADLLIDTNFLNFADISLSILQRGLIRGSKFRSWLQAQLLANTGTDSIRFRDLKPHIDLNVTFTNALDGQSVVAGCMTSPNMLVSAAVRASMSIQVYSWRMPWTTTEHRSDRGTAGSRATAVSTSPARSILTS